MKLLLSAILFLMILVPVSQSWSQGIDTESTLSVITTNESPHVYKDETGYTVIVGEVENKNALSAMSDIIIRADFYDSNGQIVETVRGGTLLDVISPESISPYIIKSSSANPDIDQVSVQVEAFNSSPSKITGLTLGSTEITHGEEFSVTGVIANTGKVPAQNTSIYIAFYDVFSPPRILHVESIFIGDIVIDESSTFNFTGTINPKSVGFQMLAESDISQSITTSAKIPKSEHEILTSLVTIDNLYLEDSDGNRISSVSTSDAVYIGSDLSFQTVADDRLQPFVYYVQIKQSGKIPYVEFVDYTIGKFFGTAKESISVVWRPSSPGLYFAETFLWDQNNVPISSKGPIQLILVK